MGAKLTAFLSNACSQGDKIGVDVILRRIMEFGTGFAK